MFTIHVIHPYSAPYEELHTYLAKGRSVGYTLQLLLIRLSITVVIIVNQMCHTTDVKIDNSFS